MDNSRTPVLFTLPTIQRAPSVIDDVSFYLSHGLVPGRVSYTFGTFHLHKTSQLSWQRIAVFCL
jgi:hypothetical protein